MWDEDNKKDVEFRSLDEETSNKAAEYDEEQIKKEAEQLDQLKPGDDLEALEQAFKDLELDKDLPEDDD